jgi:two-component sensor histidine kinase
LTLHWVERGGPPVEPPTRRGFGSRLIEQSLAADAGGKATIDYKPAGVVCVVQVRIAAVRARPGGAWP